MNDLAVNLVSINNEEFHQLINWYLFHNEYIDQFLHEEKLESDIDP